MPSKVRHNRFRKALVWSLRRHSHVVIFVALTVVVFVGATLTIVNRVQLGRQQKRALEAMTRNPIAFIMYAIQMPTSVSPLGLDNDATSAHSLVAQWQQGVEQDSVNLNNDGADDDFVNAFMMTYGQWSSQVGVSLTEIANRHCGSREFALMVAGKRDDESCGSNGGFLPQAAGELPIEPASCRAGFYADDYGRAQPSPSGTFSVDGQACFVLCARGSICNVSMPVPAFRQHVFSARAPYVKCGRQVDADRIRALSLSASLCRESRYRSRRRAVPWRKVRHPMY